MYEKIIKDERGTIRITLMLWTDRYGGVDKDGNSFRYDVTVFHKAPRKQSERLNNNILTPKELYDAKCELWKSLKPTE